MNTDQNQFVATNLQNKWYVFLLYTYYFDF